jgi:hypothetical protein
MYHRPREEQTSTSALYYQESKVIDNNFYITDLSKGYCVVTYLLFFQIKTIYSMNDIIMANNLKVL